MFSTKVFYTIAISTLLALSEAAAVPGLQKRGNGALKLGFNVIQKEQTISVNSTSVVAGDDKASTQGLTLQDKGYYYVADIFVGSDGQKVSVDVDTGSSDLWVIDSDSGVTGTYGVYDHSSSSSYQYLEPGFSIGYGDGSQASGDWVKDTIALSSGGPSIKGFEFGDATSTYKLGYGILGIGKPANEANDDQYVNFPGALKNAGLINKSAYSLYLNDIDASSGTVLFGGIDKAKIDGSLATLPITSDRELKVNAKSITIGGKDINLDADVLLDSGTTFNTFPADALEEIASAVGATYRSAGYYGWDTCDQGSGFSFNFNGVTIDVPKQDAVGKLTLVNGNQIDDCALFILPGRNGYILGDNFLRHTYAVYDLDANEISLGKIKYTDAEDITVIS